MSFDPMLGGAAIQIDPETATQAQLSALSGGGILKKPNVTVTQKFAARPTMTQAQQRQAPQINRKMIIAGYKGKADAWIRCLKGVLATNGQQVDRAFYLSLDPRELDRQPELMEVGTQAFETFVVLPYRDSLDANPIGLPAARNLHSFVGQVTEEFRNAGPVLIVLPFKTLIPGFADWIERNYEHATAQKGIAFMGYVTKKPEGNLPGAALVLPPNWSRHPDYTLAKGLSQFTNGDLSFIRDEVLRAMRPTDCIIGHGMKPGPQTCIQTFPSNEIMDQPGVYPAPAKPENYNPSGRPTVPTLPQSNIQLGQSAQTERASNSVLLFNEEEKEAALVLISQLGLGALKILDAARYGVTLADDAEFANAAQNRAQGFKIRAGKAAKGK